MWQNVNICYFWEWVQDFRYIAPLYFSVCLKYFKIEQRKFPWHFAPIYMSSNGYGTVIFHFLLVLERKLSRFPFLIPLTKCLCAFVVVVLEISSKGTFFQPLILCPPDLTHGSLTRIPGDTGTIQAGFTQPPRHLSPVPGLESHLCPGGLPARCLLPLCLEGRPRVWFIFSVLSLPFSKFPRETLPTPWPPHLPFLSQP